MGQSLHIDPNRVHALIAELTAVAESAHRDLAELKDTLSREGKPWGDDEPGRTIGETYEPQAKKGLEGYQNLVDNIRGLSKAVGEVSDALHNQDQDGGRQIRTTGSNQPVYSGTDPMWPSGATPRTSSPTTGFGSSPDDPNTPRKLPDNGATAPTQPNSTPPTQPNSTPAAYPQPGFTGYNPIGGPTPAYQQPWYPDSSTPSIEPDSPSQPCAQASTENGENAVSPPVAGTSAAAAAGAPPPTATATPRTGDPAVAERSAGTPWSKTPGPTMPPFPSGTPWAGARAGARPPRRVFAPQPGAGKPAEPKREDKPRKKKRASTKPEHVPVPTDAAVMTAVRALADRHGLHLTGFDTAGIGEAMVTQLAAAIDDILGKYPFIDLGGIEITELGDGRISQVTWDRVDSESESPTTGARILLDRTLAANPREFTEIVYAAIQSGNAVAGSEERPMYSTIVYDLGRIMAGQAGQRVRQLAQRSLITEYRRINGPWDTQVTLARIVGGFRRWRDQLGGNSIVGDRFQPHTALVAAFAEVEMRGDDACGPARVLYRLLVEGARERSTPR